MLSSYYTHASVFSINRLAPLPNDSHGLNEGGRINNFISFYELLEGAALKAT